MRRPGAGADACFDVDVYHDGEFPADHPQTTLHFCAHEQLTAFAARVAKHLADVEFIGPPEPPRPRTPFREIVYPAGVTPIGTATECIAAVRRCDDCDPSFGCFADTAAPCRKVPLQPTAPTEFISIELGVGAELSDEFAELEDDDDG